MGDTNKRRIKIYEIDKKDIQWAMHESTLTGPLGAFEGIGDTLAITGIWGTLLWIMAQNHNISFTRERSKELCFCIMEGAAQYIAGCKAATRLAHLIPGAGTVIAVVGSTLENVVFTYRFARAVTNILFKQNPDPKSWEASVGNVVDIFALDDWIEDIKDIIAIYTAPNGYIAEEIDKGALEVVRFSTKIITSKKFMEMERKVSDFVSDTSDTVADGAKYIGKTILSGAKTTVEATKKLGKWLKDNW